MNVLGITGNTENARRMAQSGLDLLVARGHEGGGHGGRSAAAALAMSCVGVWVGIRFLATEEGGALEINKQRILDSSDEDTRFSTAYTGKTLRAGHNMFQDLWDNSGLDQIPFPTQAVISPYLPASFIEADKRDYVGGLAGQVSGLIHEIKPARQIREDTVELQ